MPVPLDRPGRFRCLGGAQYWLRDSKSSSSVAVVFAFEISAWLDPTTGKWVDWMPYEQAIEGELYVIKTDGSVNQRALQTMRDVLGWNGDFTVLEQPGAWNTSPCQIEVENETYNNRTRLRVKWINPHDWDGGGRRAEAGLASRLAAQHGAAVRAMFGGSPAASPPPARPVGPTPPAPPVSPTYPPRGDQPSAPSVPAAVSAPRPVAPSAPPSLPHPSLPPPPAANAHANGATFESAWQAVCRAGHAQGTQPQVVTSTWQAKRAELFGDRANAMFLPADWERLQVETIAALPPF